MDKYISILGSTGSIGTQALEVLRQDKGFKVKALSANRNIEILKEQVKEFKPEMVCITDEKAYEDFYKEFKNHDIDILFGVEGLVKISSCKEIDLVLNALVGNAGILPTVKAIEAKKNIALANKETLVSAGELIMNKVKENDVSILPVDSEHSAIFQCLRGNCKNKIRKIYLTASGGPFRKLSKEELKNVKSSDALKHPNWSMGRKITIDSATLMNKGLEVIEAKYLFSVEFEQIQVVVHPQSIVHSMVEYEDCSVMAQLGAPDMKVPISYALNYPLRKEYNFSQLDFMKLSALTFEEPRYTDFPCLELAVSAAKTGGTMAAMVNGANEELVYKFLEDRINFTDIPLIIEKAMSAYTVKYDYNLKDVLDADAFGRSFVKEVV